MGDEAVGTIPPMRFGSFDGDGVAPAPAGAVFSTFGASFAGAADPGEGVEVDVEVFATDAEGDGDGDGDGCANVA